MHENLKPYAGSTASLLTQHGKEKVIAPILKKINDCHIKHVNHFDTDKLGTFTRETPRYGSQLDAARKKARIGMELTGLSIGLANEGSFANDPYTGLLPWNYEVVILIDDIRKIEITGYYGGESQSESIVVSCWKELEKSLPALQFPSHHLVLYPDNVNNPFFLKGISTVAGLKKAFNLTLEKSVNGLVFIENDLRANTNPSRMRNISIATDDLSRKMNSICPDCNTPGYWIHQTKKGLPCSVCNRNTNLPIAKLWQCTKCNYGHEESIIQDHLADPSKCNFCNP